MAKNKIILLVLILTVVILIYYFVFKKRVLMDKNDPKSVFPNLTNEPELNDIAERIYRKETAHFTSNIFQQTNGAGILAVSSQYPYGWLMLKNLWDKNPDIAPVGIYDSPNGYSYLIFPNLYAGAKAVAEIIKKRFDNGQHAGYYNSTVPAIADQYRDELTNVHPKFADYFEDNKFLML